MKELVQVLLVDDNTLDSELVRDALEQEPGRFRVTAAASRSEFEARLAEGPYDLVLTDFNILGFSGLQVLAAIQAEMPLVPVVIVTGTGSEEVAAEAIKLGAADYVIKTPEHIQRLPHTLRSVIASVRFQREHERDEAELRFRADLLLAVGQAVIATRLDGTVIYWNRAAEILYGWPAGEALGRNVGDLNVAPASHAQAAEIMSQLRDGKSWSGEFPLWRRDGARLSVLVSDSPLHDEAGVLTGIIGVSVDITELRRTQQEESAQRQFAEALRDTAAELSGTLDYDEVLERSVVHADRVVTNDGADIILLEGGQVRIIARDWPAVEEAMVSRGSITIPVAAIPRLRDSLVAGDALFIADTQADPTWRQLPIGWKRSMVAAPIRTRGQLVGVLTVGSLAPHAYAQADAAHLQAYADQVAVALENARLYKESERRLDEIRVVSDVALLGASGQPLDETVARATEALRRLWPQADSLGFLFVDDSVSVLRPHPSYYCLSPGCSDSAVPLDLGLTGWAIRSGQAVLVGNVRHDSRYLNRGSGVGSEMVAPLSDGGHAFGVVNVESHELDAFTEDDMRVLATLALQLATIFAKTRLDAALALERDLLVQRVDEQTAELRAANARLHQAARLKDEFLANMSHELRTPLTSILGLGEALQEGVYGPLTTKQVRSLHTIEESGRHLLSLINDILDLSKADAGKIDLQITPVTVAQVCQASMQFLRHAAKQRQLSISIELDPQAKIVQADERYLKQVLINLLSNAVKFTPEGGAVGLEVLADRAQSVISFAVWDTGIGIAQESLDLIFQPFVQLDSSLSRTYQGTGLGLALAEKLVNLHGGAISVESAVGKGSRFTVSLPWQGPYNELAELPADADRHQGRNALCVQKLPEGSPELATGVAESAPDKRALILLADDNATSAEAIIDYLTAVGYRVITARDGHEALAQARAALPNLILMDVQMPGMSGLEVIGLLRNDQQLPRMPVIALTALAMPGDRERSLAAGANDYISKPVSLKNLSAAISRLLQQGGSGS